MASNANIEALRDNLYGLRRALESAFAPDTAAEGFDGTTPSTGHCAAVAVIVNSMNSGELVSTTVKGNSHWFNRLAVGEVLMDVDLTGDQFGFPAVQFADAGQLYLPAQVRARNEVTPETLNRARLLATRAGLEDVVKNIEAF